VEVADERHVHAQTIQLGPDEGNRLGRRVVVDGDADELGSGMGQLRDLDGGAVGIGGVGVRHRLDDDRVGRANRDAADQHGPGGAAQDGAHRPQW
jgi:hypothetical protein